MIYNPLFLRIKVIEMDDIVKSPSLMETVRGLTLKPYSGMNAALNHYQFLSEKRSVDAVGIFANYLSIPVGWCLFTYEADTYEFRPAKGEACAQVFVKQEYRRLGIGFQLMSMATKLSRPDKLKVYSWSEPQFFASFINDFSLNVTSV